MAGSLYDGRDVTRAKNGVKNNSKAYCEGITYRASDSAANAPKDDNPHQVGSEAAEAWDAGWDAADAAAGGQMGKGTSGPCPEGQSIPA
jgi:hypothetical protein